MNTETVYLYVDDIRTPPEEAWTIARTAQEAIKILSTGRVRILSLDHDLGTEETGYSIATWLEEKIATNPFFPPPEKILIHSANPVGRKKIQQAIDSINKLREKSIQIPTEIKKAINSIIFKDWREFPILLQKSDISSDPAEIPLYIRIVTTTHKEYPVLVRTQGHKGFTL